MAHGYTPGLRVTEATLLRKERRLPLPGEVHVAVGQWVGADDLVASTRLPGNVTTVNVAHALNLQPPEIGRAMVKAEGDAVRHGELIAEVKAMWGLFHSTATAPVAGTIESISAVTGHVLVRGEPVPVELEAYVAGEIVELLGDDGVVVQSPCAFVQGIIGVGGEAHGPLVIRVGSPEETLEAERIDEACAGAVVVGGSLVTLAALHRAVAVGAKGVVVGGIADRALDEFLGAPLGVAITGHENKGVTLVVTEGFGQIRMSDRAWNLLSAREGQQASINGATQIRAGVIRPEVIIPYPRGQAPQMTSDASEGGALRVGSAVRLIRDPYFGSLGKVVGLPEELRQIETEAHVRVLVAELADGRRVEVPRANVELVEG